MKKIKFITDRGSNMIAAFRRHTRLDCIAHLISTCLKHTLGKKHSPIPIQELLSSCTALVKLFKQKPVLNSQLQVCLKLMCDTRFNTVYMMLLPIQTQYHTIYELLQKGGYDVDMVDIIDKALLSSLVAFLKPFYDATNQLEGELAPTIQFVLPIIMRLQNHCAGATDPVMTEEEDDHDVMATLRRTCRRLLKEKFKSHTLHKVALFLSPRFKRMAGLDDQDHQEVYNFVKTEMREIVVDEVVGNAHRVDEDYMMSFPEFDEEESTHWEGSGIAS